jgi:uncharacterized protein (UPF0216 family)
MECGTIYIHIVPRNGKFVKLFGTKRKEVREARMPEISPGEIITIADAEKEYGRNRKTLEKLVDERKLSVVKIEGDRKIYLVRAELDTLFKPRIVQPREDAG